MNSSKSAMTIALPRVKAAKVTDAVVSRVIPICLSIRTRMKATMQGNEKEDGGRNYRRDLFFDLLG